MLAFLLLFTPACAAALLYNRFSPGKRSSLRLILIAAVFALPINVIMCSIFTGMGYDIIFVEEYMADASYCRIYLLAAFGVACLLVAMAVGADRLSRLIKVGREKKRAGRED